MRAAPMAKLLLVVSIFCGLLFASRNEYSLLMMPM